MRENDKILETVKGSTSSHSVENLLRKISWICRKTDYEMTALRLELRPTQNNRVGGLSGKHPAILNISRTGHVALM